MSLYSISGITRDDSCMKCRRTIYKEDKILFYGFNKICMECADGELKKETIELWKLSREVEKFHGKAFSKYEMISK